MTGEVYCIKEGLMNTHYFVLSRIKGDQCYFSVGMLMLSFLLNELPVLSDGFVEKAHTAPVWRQIELQWSLIGSGVTVVSAKAKQSYTCSEFREGLVFGKGFRVLSNHRMMWTNRQSYKLDRSWFKIPGLRYLKSGLKTDLESYSTKWEKAMLWQWRRVEGELFGGSRLTGLLLSTWDQNTLTKERFPRKSWMNTMSLRQQQQRSV